MSTLVYNPDISEDYPVVAGTWVTVGRVLSLLVDGYTWYDIIQAHPELTEDDIRTCVAWYTAELEN